MRYRTPHTRNFRAMFGIGLAAALFCGTPSQAAQIPDLYSNGGAWSIEEAGGSRENYQPAPPQYPGGGALTIGAHPDYPHFGNSSGRPPTLRIGNDLSPLLLPWAAEHIRRGNAEVLAGAVPFTPASRCWPAGVPAVLTFGIEPILFLQTETEVTILYQRGQVTRHVFLNRPHSQNLTPSWYGEFIGHYEDEALIVDTMGLSDRSLIDSFRTPHTTALHVIERYRLVENGRKIEVVITVEDPGTFTAPWSFMKSLIPAGEGIEELLCQLNNGDVFNQGVRPVPSAQRADF